MKTNSRKFLLPPLLRKQRPTLYLDVREGVRHRVMPNGKWIVDSLVVKVHGGFTQTISFSGRNLLTRNNPILGRIRDWETRHTFMKRGPGECLKRLNTHEYKELLRWHKELLRQESTTGIAAPAHQEVQRHIQNARRWIREFANWFLEHRIDLPDVAPAPRGGRIYKIKHFKEVVAQMKTYNKSKSLDLVCEKYGFQSREGFEKQFDKWPGGSKIRKG